MSMAPTSEFKVFGLRLWQQVLIGLVLGVIYGLVLGEDAAGVKLLGDIFIHLIKMIVVPLIFLALVSGITSMDSGGDFARVGLKSLVAYFFTASFAVVIGIVTGILFEPGAGVIIDMSSITAVATDSKHQVPSSASDFILHLIPTNAIKAMADGQFLQVIVFAAFVGLTINVMGDKAYQVRTFLHEAAQIMFKMIELIIRLAPLAVFGFIAWSVGMQGLDILETLAWLVVAVFAACFFQYLVFGVMILVFGRLNPMPFYKKLFTTQLMAFSTSSSKATLTTAMSEMENKLGVSESSVKFVLPLGACINMDGTAIYLGICALFFSQIYGIPLGMPEYLLLIITSTLGSIGAAGIPSGSIIFMGMVLGSVGLPIEGIGLILGVDRLLDMLRTAINITGDCTITLLVDRSEDGLDESVYYGEPKKVEA